MNNIELVTPIVVKVTVNGNRYGKELNVDALFGYQDIQDFVTDWVADEWSDYPAEAITDILWQYV